MPPIVVSPCQTRSFQVKRYKRSYRDPSKKLTLAYRGHVNSADRHGAELKWGRKFSETMTFACICSERISEINENDFCVSVCMFTQPDYSNSRGHEEQPLNLPHASTSAAADEVKHLYLLFSCITAGNINKFG